MWPLQQNFFTILFCDFTAFIRKTRPDFDEYFDVTSMKKKFISHILDSKQTTRCKVINKPPTVSNAISFNLIFLGVIETIAKVVFSPLVKSLN